MGSSPVRQDELARELFCQGCFTFPAIFHRQSNEVGHLLGDSSRVKPSHRQDTSNYGVFIPTRQVRTANHHTREEQSWVRAVLSWVRQPSLCDRGLYPVWLDYGDKRFACRVVIGEVGGSGNDMSYFGERNPARREREPTAYRTVLLEQLSELCSISICREFRPA